MPECIDPEEEPNLLILHMIKNRKPVPGYASRTPQASSENVLPIFGAFAPSRMTLAVYSSNRKAASVTPGTYLN